MKMWAAYKLQQCLRRRAVGYEFANLISLECHERYIDKLMRRLKAEPPANYQATTMSQVLCADRQVWVYLSQNANDIRPLADGTRPLDRGLDEALSDYDVTFHLLPLPFTVPNAYAPVRNREMQSGRDDQNFKGFDGNRSPSQTSRVRVQPQEASREPWAETTVAGLSVSTTTCQNVQTVEHVAKGVMCASRQTASRHTSSAQRTRTRCPRPCKAKTDLMQSRVVSQCMIL